MGNLKLKKYVLPTTLMTLGFMSITTAFVLTNADNELKSLEQVNYVSGTIISRDVAVINTTRKVIYPYTDPNVKLGKMYYDYKGTVEEQEKAIVYYENTYIQNSGVDFVSENPFSIVSILDGTVTNVREDETLGKIIEISHNNDYMSVYQSLSDIKVKKGDNISQGQTIGISGTNQLDKDLGNHLHFELYIGGQIVQPTKYLDKEIDIQTNE